MATLNFATRELTAKIVFFGAQGAGCNTNVARLFQLVPGTRRSALLKLASEGEAEHSWCFELADPEPAPVEGFSLVFRVYSLPGAIGLAAHRDEVLRGADAVAFVADARSDRNQRNLDALLELEGRLARSGAELAHTVVALQVNHTDAEGARPLSDVLFDLNPYGFPVHEAVAHEGIGVAETFQALGARIREAVTQALSGAASPLLLTATHDPHRATDVDLLRAHVASIHTQLRTPPAQEARAFDDAPVEVPAEEIEPGPTVEVPFQPRELAGFHPVRVLSTTVDGDRVWVELAMERMGGGEVRRVALVLQNRPPDTRSPAAPPPAQPQPLPPPTEGSEHVSVFDYLPQSVVYAEPAGAVRDLPGVVYGLLGVGGGILIGLLSAYVLGAV